MLLVVVLLATPTSAAAAPPPAAMQMGAATGKGAAGSQVEVSRHNSRRCRCLKLARWQVPLKLQQLSCCSSSRPPHHSTTLQHMLSVVVVALVVAGTLLLLQWGMQLGRSQQSQQMLAVAVAVVAMLP